MLFHVVAMARNRVIGKANRLPWHFTSDLKNFKRLTFGNTVLMGRKTFDSIGRPLPGRQNFVLSRSRIAEAANLKFFDSLDRALASVATRHCFIIGGADLFRQTIDRVDGIYLTLIEASYEGGVFYPEIPAVFLEKSRVLLQENPNLYFIFYENKSRVLTPSR